MKKKEPLNLIMKKYYTGEIENTTFEGTAPVVTITPKKQPGSLVLQMAVYLLIFGISFGILLTSDWNKFDSITFTRLEKSSARLRSNIVFNCRELGQYIEEKNKSMDIDKSTIYYDSNPVCTVQPPDLNVKTQTNMVRSKNM